MRDKRDFIARALAEHNCTSVWGYVVCKNCGKTADEVGEQEEPAVCWAEVADSDSPYLIPPRVETAHPIESGEDFWLGDEWWPLSIKATEGER